MAFRRRDFLIQNAYLDTGALFRQTPVLSYPFNGCSLYSWQAQQHAYCLWWRFARNQLLDPLKFLLAELVHPHSLYVHGKTRHLPPLAYDPSV